jgi:hypothetical protein
VHGQGLTNAIFLRKGAVLVELLSPKFGALHDFGHAPLARGLGLHYVGAKLAEGPKREECGVTNWRINPECPSYVNVSRLEAVLDAVMSCSDAASRAQARSQT